MAAVSVLMIGVARQVFAQDSKADPVIKIYVDPRTHILYTEPGKDRRFFAQFPASALSDLSIESRQEKTEQELRANQQQLSTVIEQNQQLEANNNNLNRQISEMGPAWRSYIDNFQDKFRLGTLVYGDYRFYTHTGFQPQELTQITNPGPGNNDWSSFEISRAPI